VLSLKQNEDEARERLRAFWSGASLGRPALIVEADDPTFVEKPWRGPALDAKGRDLLPEWYTWMAGEHLRHTVYLAEAMPNAALAWGSHLVLLATLAGGDYEYHAGSAWIEPMSDVYERPLPRFDPDHTVVRCLDLCLRRIAQEVGDRAYLNPPALLDAMTTLSMFRGPGALATDLVDRPEDVRRWCEAGTALNADAYEHFWQVAKSLGYGDTST